MSVPSERGAAAVTAVVLWCATAVAGLIAVGTVADVALAAARARAAADAAALAAAGATLLGPSPADPRAAAAAAARLHGAALRACCGDEGAIPPRIRVSVAVRPGSVLGRAVAGAVVRSASASLRPPERPVGGASGLTAGLPKSGGAPGRQQARR